MTNIQLLFRRYKVDKAFVFGSMAKNTATASSDVDFLVSFDKKLDYKAYTDILTRNWFSKKWRANPFKIKEINHSIHAELVRRGGSFNQWYNYFDLLNALRELLNKDVGLVAEETVTNPYLLQIINATKVQLL